MDHRWACDSVCTKSRASTASLLPAMSGFRFNHIVSTVSARLLNRVLPSVKERELRLSLEQ
jgi:hypothetical protein